YKRASHALLHCLLMKLHVPHSTRLAASFAALCGLTLGSAGAAPMDFSSALQHMATASDRLAASRLATDSAAQKRRAIEHLGGPSVGITAAAYAYNASLDLDLDPLGQALPGIAAQLPPALGGAVAQLPHLPASYTLNRQKTNATASV